MANDQKLMFEIESRKESLIELTQDLIKIPTVNPPCANYLEICEFLKKRLESSGFETQLIRAKGAIADSDKYPRWNI
ncbi:MAG: succinyl-diaminopimelate desuccinylase, partial [Paracoccaceae bacterium]|nr:succinyl-diaminopimelate desuccinylase [Paracoccaceae bacterium]